MWGCKAETDPASFIILFLLSFNLKQQLIVGGVPVRCKEI